MHPRDQISAFSVYGYDYTISGHEYRIVPTNDFITLPDYVPHFLASPKSASLMLKSPSIKILEGARSLWTTLLSMCKCLNAAVSYDSIFQTTSSFTFYF